MDIAALLLSRLQFAFTVSFHIIFPSFRIALAGWLTVLEALRLVEDMIELEATGDQQLRIDLPRFHGLQRVIEE
jgi:cytochrome bd-type quinol oxidase subunit 1